LNPDLIDERFRNVREEDRPLVLLCGWAGATPKNLSKYSDLYHRAGCFTLGYNLPSRFVFTDTSEVPCISRELLKVIEAEKLLNRPIFLHLMSDTGNKAGLYVEHFGIILWLNVVTQPCISSN
jgi:hypothetical protein